jgi:hypothetical protein
MQLDLFAAPPAPKPMSAIGTVEILCCGKKTPERRYHSEAGLYLSLRSTSAGIELDGSHDVHNCGGSGPSRREPFATRTDALIYVARWAIKRCAHDEALADGWPDYTRSARDYRAMVTWLDEQLPPLLSGFDAMAELADMRARAKTKEAARRADLKRQHERNERENAAIRAVEAYGYPNLVQDGQGWLATFSSDDDGTIVLHPHRSLSEQDAPRLDAMAAKLVGAGFPTRIAA